VSGEFSTSYRATIGADFIAKTIHLSHGEALSGTDGQGHTSDVGEPVVLQIWDTAGQERFSALSSAFFRGADAAIIVYDVRRPKSLAEVAMWWRAFAEKCPVASEDEATWPVVVVGNKIDLLDHTEDSEDAIWREEEARNFVSRLIDVGPSEIEDEADASTEEDGLPQVQVQEERSKPVSININGNGHHDSFNGFGVPSESNNLNSANGTFRSTRTGNTIYHTPSSSFHEDEHFHSASSSFYTDSLSSASAPVSRSASRTRRLTIDTLSSSSATITQSLYARNRPQDDALPQTPRTPSIRHPTPEPPERGAKLLFASAKSGEGVKEVFNYIARRTVHRLEWTEADVPFGETALPLVNSNTNLAQFGALHGRCC